MGLVDAGLNGAADLAPLEDGGGLYGPPLPDFAGSWKRLKDKSIFKNDFELYKSLYLPISAKTGGDPSDYFNDPANALGRVSLLGKRDTASPRLAEILRRVDRRLTATPVNNGFAALQVRKIEGSLNISLHTLGEAIDIDAVRNPHIKSPAQIAVIKEVTGIDLGKPQSRADLRRADSLFRANFDSAAELIFMKAAAYDEKVKLDRKSAEQWKAERTRYDMLASTLRNDLKSVGKRKKSTFAAWRDHGFFNLPDELIDAFQDADPNVVWGGEYGSSKDFMHFEYHPSLRRQIQRRATKSAR